MDKNPALNGPDDLESFVRTHEAGVRDVLEAYETVAASYAAAVGAWQPTVVASSTTAFVSRHS